MCRTACQPGMTGLAWHGRQGGGGGLRECEADEPENVDVLLIFRFRVWYGSFVRVALLGFGSRRC